MRTSGGGRDSSLVGGIVGGGAVEAVEDPFEDMTVFVDA